MMNMTMNATEMANDTITDAAEEMPASDDGRRKLLAGHEGHSDDDTMDMMNDTMMNMTANATEMANDTITDAAEEMPASDDGRRMLLQLDGLQDSVTGVVDKAKDAASNAKDKVTDVANKAVDKATEIVDKANATL